MLFFASVFLTDDRISILDRGRLPPPRRSEVFRYALASMRELSFEHAYIHCALDKGYEADAALIEAEVAASFPSYTLEFRRPLTPTQWREALARMFNEYPGHEVFFTNNDDHVFVDRDVSCFNDCIGAMRALGQGGQETAISYSHWPEALGMRCRVGAHAHSWNAVEGRSNESILVLQQQTLKRWFFDSPLPEREYRRSNDLPFTTPIAMVIPHRELFRHFDGYSHAGIEIDRCPPLRIPEGFFSDEFRVAAGRFSPERHRQLVESGCGMLDPRASSYLAVDPMGVDFRRSRSQMPGFWARRAAEIVEGEFPEDPQAEDRATYEMIQPRADIGLQPARKLFPAAFRLPPEASAAIAAAETGQTRAIPLHRADKLRVHKTPWRSTTPLSLLFVDHSSENCSPIHDSLAALSSIGPAGADRRIGAHYLTLRHYDNGEGFFPPLRRLVWTATSDQCIDGLMLYLYDYFYDKSKALGAALERIESPYVLVVEMHHRAARMDLLSGLSEVLDVVSSWTPDEDKLHRVPLRARVQRSLIEYHRALSAFAAPTAFLRRELRKSFCLDIESLYAHLSDRTRPGLQSEGIMPLDLTLGNQAIPTLDIPRIERPLSHRRKPESPPRKVNPPA